MNRKLTITLQADWKAGLRAAATVAKAGQYQGETLNFETPAAFFGRMTELRWGLVRALQSAGGELGVRELARLVGRDVRRVHDDLAVLQELGLIERSEAGGVLCPFEDIHVDMHLSKAA